MDQAVGLNELEGTQMITANRESKLNFPWPWPIVSTPWTPLANSSATG